MSARRQFLVGAGAAGLAVGAATGAVLIGDDGRAADLRFEEAGGAADAGEQVARLGTHRVVWNTSVTEPIAAITFDGGPTPEYTPRLLSALADAGVTAAGRERGAAIPPREVGLTPAAC